MSGSQVTMKWKYNGSSLVVKWQSSASQVADEWPLSGIAMVVKWLKVGGGGAEN